jgi:O-antigen/teichoic acid export membrane protein
MRLRLPLAETLLFTTGSAGLGVASGILAARSLGPTSRGELAIVLLWPSLLSMFADLGLGHALAYHAADQRWRNRNLILIGLTAAIVLGTIAAVIAASIVPASLRHISEEARSGLRMSISSTSVLLISYYASSVLLGVGLLRAYNVVRFLSTLLYTVGVVYVVSYGTATVRSYTVVYIVANSVAALVAVSLVIIKAGVNWSGGSVPVERFLKYGVKTYLASLTSQATLRLDQVLLSFLVIPEMLGYYAVAVAMSGAVSPLFNAAAIVILPRTLHSLDAAEGGRATVRTTLMVIALAIPAVLVAIIFCPWLVRLIYGPAFQPATASTRVLFVAGLFQGGNAILGNGLRGLGFPGEPARAELFGMVLTIALLLVLLIPFGILGAALTSLLAYGSVLGIQLLRLCECTGLGVTVVSSELLRSAVAACRRSVSATVKEASDKR